jgi:hypothetical protein
VQRIWAGQTQALGLDAEILALPFYDGAVQALQDEDGNPLFMIGISAWGGDDAFGGP